MHEDLVLPVGFVCKDTAYDLNTCFFKAAKAAPRYTGIGVCGRGNNFFDTGLDQGLTTGTRPAIVGTGLQSHISRSACSLLACVVHGIDFGMGLTGLVMIPFSHHVSIRTYDDTSDERIGTCRPAGLFSKIQGHLHIFLISQICSPSLKKAMPSPRGDSTAFTVLWLHCLFSSRLYCRYWNLTNSCPKARGLYRRLGISPCPKDNSYEIASLL